MTEEDWHHGEASTIGWGLKQVDSTTCRVLLVLFNAKASMVSFQLPKNETPVAGVDWQVLLDTVSETGKPQHPEVKSGTVLNLAARSLMVLSSESSLS